MARKNSFDIVRQIFSLLKKEKELSVKSVSHKINAQWITALNALEFMKEFNIVKERFGKATYKSERLFSLK